jgi:hypothetical protein
MSDRPNFSYALLMELHKAAEFIVGPPSHYEMMSARNALRDAASKVDAAWVESQAFAEEIETARELYAMGSDDDVEIDDHPMLSVADEGVWVSAWVWVPRKDAL